ncbi:MAG TPA: PilZ domain-containing protein [Chloroflexota bacterium]|nr:PilZ domain-containing protein [Chloroflexota bacterium]
MAAVAAEVGQKAHARMLEERQTPASGDALPLADALHLLQSGQLVNFAAGPNAAPGRILTSGVPSPSAAQIAAELGRSLGVPTELVLDGRQGEETEITAAEVLTIDHAAGEIFLGFDEAPHGVSVDFPAVIDFTDATGTYYLAGSVTVVHDGSGGFRPRANVRVRHASLVQLRRFVRVPVLISPLSLEVQDTPSHWHAVRGEIIDLSLGGLGLLAEEPFFAGARIRVTFELPGRYGDLTVTGRVVPPPGPAEAHTGPRGGDEARLAYRRGVALDPLPIDDLRTLQRALYHRQVELRRMAEPFAAPRRPKFRDPGTAVPPNRPTSKSRLSWLFWRR